MSEKRLKVYISSPRSSVGTITDLGRLARQVVIRNNLQPMDVSSLQAIEPAKTAINAKIKISDIFIGIYHSNPSSSQIGEYNTAQKLKIPTLIYFDSKARAYRNEWVYKHDTDDFQRNSFLDNLLEKHVIHFATVAHEFESSLTQQLSQIKKSINTEDSSETPILPNYSPPYDYTSPTNIQLPSDFDERVRANTYQSIEDYFRQIAEKPLSNDPEQITIKPIFGQVKKNPEYQSDIFVIMPFKDELKPIYELIQEVAEDIDGSLSVKRGDDFISNEHIMSEVWYAIANAKLIIADCTGKNANVFYELGIAHTLGKPVIVITQNIADLPFDIMSRRAIPYTDSMRGTSKLKSDLKDKIPRMINSIGAGMPDTE